MGFLLGRILRSMATERWMVVYRMWYAASMEGGPSDGEHSDWS